MLHKRGGVPVLVKGSAIIAITPVEIKLENDPPMVVVVCSFEHWIVLETIGEILDGITLSYKQVTRK